MSATDNIQACTDTFPLKKVTACQIEPPLMFSPRMVSRNNEIMNTVIFITRAIYSQSIELSRVKDLILLSQIQV